MVKTKKGNEKKRPGTVAASADAGTAQHQGVAKRKHGLGAGKRELAARLEAEAASTSRSPNAKARRSRKTTATILSAVDGMKASLDELLAANDQAQRLKAGAGDPIAGSSLSSKRRQKLVAEETEHMQQVLQHPAFVADPFGALQEHLANTMAAMEDKAKERSQRR